MTFAETIPVAGTLLESVLRPYKEGCRYVLRAHVEPPAAGDAHLARIRGRLAIPESCYIEDTGHFNSVEFNLCYNQLVYLLMAQCVVDGLLPCFRGWTLERYLERQLPDVLIHDFASKFRRPLDPRDFEGTVDILDTATRKGFLLLHTGVAFADGSGGSARGSVSLAIVERGAQGAPTNGRDRARGT